MRSAVYEFRGRLAPTMRAGRALLVGDAAHTMPPFMGQGMCSGIRDAAALAWRLDLILRGLADDRLLDSYTEERRPQNEWIVNLSTEMGRVSCVLDAQAAAERDAALRAADAASGDRRCPGSRAGCAPSMRCSRASARFRGRCAGATESGRLHDLIDDGGFVLLSRDAPGPVGRASAASWSGSEYRSSRSRTSRISTGG